MTIMSFILRAYLFIKYTIKYTQCIWRHVDYVDMLDACSIDNILALVLLSVMVIYLIDMCKIHDCC